MNLAPLLNQLGVIVTRDIRRRIRDGQVTPGSRGGGTTLVRSAKLVNSITHAVEDDRVVVGTNLRYARIHHFGGIIRPRTAKYLAIPLTKAASAKKPREWENTFVSKGVIFRKMEDGNTEALYALKKEVVMPARPYMFISDTTRTSIEKAAAAWLAGQQKER